MAATKNNQSELQEMLRGMTRCLAELQQNVQAAQGHLRQLEAALAQAKRSSAPGRNKQIEDHWGRFAAQILRGWKVEEGTAVMARVLEDNLCSYTWVEEGTTLHNRRPTSGPSPSPLAMHSSLSSIPLPIAKGFKTIGSAMGAPGRGPLSWKVEEGTV